MDSISVPASKVPSLVPLGASRKFSTLASTTKVGALRSLAATAPKAKAAAKAAPREHLDNRDIVELPPAAGDRPIAQATHQPEALQGVEAVADDVDVFAERVGDLGRGRALVG